jgi:hypothetical protein
LGIKTAFGVPIPVGCGKVSLSYIHSTCNVKVLAIMHCIFSCPRDKQFCQLLLLVTAVYQRDSCNARTDLHVQCLCLSYHEIQIGVVMFYSTSTLSPSPLMLSFVERAFLVLLGDLPLPPIAIAAIDSNSHSSSSSSAVAVASQAQSDGGSSGGGALSATTSTTSEITPDVSAAIGRVAGAYSRHSHWLQQSQSQHQQQHQQHQHHGHATQVTIAMGILQ